MKIQNLIAILFVSPLLSGCTASFKSISQFRQSTALRSQILEPQQPAPESPNMPESMPPLPEAPNELVRFVATNGDDLSVGSFEKPFRTIERAQQWVRASDPSKPKVVYLRGGLYQLDRSLRFGSSDGGTNAWVTYSAYQSEAVTISGGTKVTQFTVAGSLHYADLPGLVSRQLYTGSAILEQPTPVRFPAQSYFQLLGYDFKPGSCIGTANPTKTSVLQSIKVRMPAPLPETYITALAGSELVILKSFTQSRVHVTSVTANGPDLTVTLTPTSGQLEGCNYDWVQELGYRVYFEKNWRFFETPSLFAPRPGSFTFANGALYFYARPSDRALMGGVVVPHLERLVEIDGASKLKFFALEFKHTGANGPSQSGYVGGQAGRSGFCISFPNCVLPSMISVRNSTNIIFERLTLAHAGGHGLSVEQSEDITITKSKFEDISGNAITVGTFSTLSNLASRRIRVTHNLINSVGRMYDGVGILVGFVLDSAFSNNSISEVSYSGISLGWFGQSDLPASNSVVRFNNIGQVNQLHGDGGGIYLMEGTKGDLVSDNYVHDIKYKELGFTSNTRHGIYLDNKTTGVTVENNQIVGVINALFLQNQIGYQSTFNIIRSLWISDVEKNIFDGEHVSPTNVIQLDYGVQPSIVSNSGAHQD